MGGLRLLLALIVLVSHFAPLHTFDTMISGALAVRIFYLISGFYIQGIISRYEGRKHWKRNFYSSRLLRLFPTYYLMLILTIWLNGSSCNNYCISMVTNDRWSSLVFYYASNLFIFGQDVAKFLTYHYSNGLFSYDPDIARPNYWVGNMAILGQSWSLAMELLFYLAAPFLLKKSSRSLTGIALLSLTLKLSLAAQGYTNVNTWYNGFFPSELHTFILGALAGRIAAGKMPLAPPPLSLALGGLLFLIAWTFHVALLPADPDELAVIGVFCLLPYIFQATRNNRLDKSIGELSYPIYLNHLLVMTFLGRYIHAPLPWLLGSVLLSAGMAVAIVRFIEQPLTRFRHRKFRASRACSSDAGDSLLPALAATQPLPIPVYIAPNEKLGAIMRAGLAGGCAQNQRDSA